MAAFFPRNFYNTDNTSFTPLFRLLDDFDNYSRQGQSARQTSIPHWQPKFDVRETSTAYELHGELPGVSKENVHIEFTEPQTMLIRGKTVRTYTSTTPAAAPGEEASTQPAEKKPADKVKYWLTERSVGEFARSFNFPTRVDQDTVSANFQEGILTIVVPKAKKHESRRITVF
ncbi:HSP20-like chaperone [Ilyonectria sp. MPI-CAGE-AT-0026]|nr:HSP20-like chaperone [Ilyonectria sp. MPI-CAGE-AT-0026]